MHMLSDKKIGFIGAGNMGAALIDGIIAAGTVLPASIIAYDADEGRLRDVAQATGIRSCGNCRSVALDADVVLLAVKPSTVPSVLDEIAVVAAPDKLIVSIAAGVRLSSLEERLPARTPVVRVMPNILATIRSAVSALSPGSAAADEHLGVAKAIMEAVGATVVVEERHMDAVTGLSGSGPAYVFTVIDALADGGVKMGLPRDVALKLAVHTVMGSARMVAETGKHPMVLRDAVTSPGGTTIAGLHVLEREAVRSAFMGAVEAAARRAGELGG